MRKLKDWFRVLKRVGGVSRELIKLFCTFKKPWRLLLAYLGFPFKYPAQFEFRKFSKFRLKVWEHTDVVTLWGVFCREEYQVKNKDRQIIDVGANVGFFSVYAAIKAPQAKIFAYEPVKAVYEKLIEQVRTNYLESRVICFNAAIDTFLGVRKIFLLKESVNSSFYGNEQGLGSETVSTVTLPFSLADNRIEELSLLKMDCEGAEWEIFNRLQPSDCLPIRRISMEIHLLRKGQSKALMCDMLKKLGFQFQKPRSNSLDILNFEQIK